MAIFQWDKSFETGIQVIDGQHRRLVDLVNGLHDAMLQMKAKETIEGVLSELVDYTRYHFHTEERAFSRYGYQAADEHARIHGQFVDKAADLADKYKKGSLVITVETLGFLVDWVKNHILKEDMRYVPFLSGKDIDADA